MNLSQSDHFETTLTDKEIERIAEVTAWKTASVLVRIFLITCIGLAIIRGALMLLA